ncbi:pyridoxal phosphate-dependent transferase [Aspergillus aurantiobrunneus]
MSTSFFSSAPYIPPDAIFALPAEYLADPGPQKVKLATSQAISGTGSLHLAGKILKYCSPNPTLPTVYIPTPTWSNHHLVFSSLGFPCTFFQYYNAETNSLDIDSYLSTLRSAPQRSIIILHACAHNPTGLDPTIEQWKEIGSIVKERGLFPLFDVHAWAVRYFVRDLGLEAAVCLSFAKNMGLYGERVGCLLATSTPDTARNAQSALESLQRSEISNPPAFGARVAETILSDEKLRGLWFEDLKTLSGRIQEMRRALIEGLGKYASGNWEHLIRQSGMFGFLGLSRHVVKVLKDEYHIYMAENSRISIAGLNTGNVDYVARSIGEVLGWEK